MENGVNLPRHWLLRALQLETDRAHGATHPSRGAGWGGVKTENGATPPRHWLLRALQLETDRAHGATHLSREAVRAFREAVEEAWTAEADPDEGRARLVASRTRLERPHPTMAPMAHRLHRVAAALEH